MAEDQWESLPGVRKYFYYTKEMVSPDWKDLAFHLGFERADVDNIDGRNRNDKSRCMDLLEEWLKRNGERATIEVLMEALSEADLQSVVDGLRRKVQELDPGMEDFIRKNYVNLRNMLDVKPAIPHLIQHRVLTTADKQRILSKETKEDKAEELIDTLSSSGKCTPKQFINILRMTNQTGLIERLSVDRRKNKYQETIEDLIKENYTLLCGTLRANELIPQFIQKRLLDLVDKQVIMSKVTTQSRAEALLDLLSEKGTCTPEMFVEILKEGDHWHIVDQLKRTSTQNEPIEGDSSVPLEIQLRGPAMQQLYSQACRQGTRPMHSTRGLVVGQFRSGKTCVVRRLTGEEAVKNEPITDGIEISPSVMTKTWRKAKEEPDEFKEAMAERLAEQQVVGQQSDSKTPTEEAGKQTLQTQQKEPLKEERPTQSQQTANLEDERSGECVNRAASQQTQHQQRLQGDVPVQQQAQDIPNDVITKAKERLQGGVTEEQLGTAEHPRLSIWDFGGQAAYYGSHQSFFTYRGIYILVMSLLQKLSDPVPDLDYKASADNLVTGKDYLDHWLNSVHTHTLVHGRERTGVPPVVLVLTHKDMVSEFDIENYKKEVLDHISGKAAGEHVLPRIFVVDNFDKDNSDIDELQEYLREVAKSQWYMGEKVPITWLHLKSKLMDKRREDEPFCPFQDVVDLARSDDVGITDDSHVADILTFLHDLGDIIFINEPVLRDHVALRPQVMIDVFKTIITVPEYQQDRSMGGEVAKMWKRLENEGILSDRLLTTIWTKADEKMQKPFLLQNKTFLKQLMEKYYLICNATPISGFDDTMQGPEKEEIYFVPSLLASKPDDETLYPGHMTRCQSPLYVVFDNMFLPSGMFYRLQAICVRRFGLQESRVFVSCGRFPTNDAKQQFVVTKEKHYLKVELLSSESDDQSVFTQGLPVRKFLSSCLFEIKEKWIPSIQYDWCFGGESAEGTGKMAFHKLSDIGREMGTGSTSFPEDFVDVWVGGSGAQRMPRAENSGGAGPVMIEPTLRPNPVHTIGPILDCMEMCDRDGGLSLADCDRIRHELTFVSRFKELVATVNNAGDKRHRLLGASVEVCLPERAAMFPRQERGNKIVVLHVGDYNDKLVRPLLEKAVQSSGRYGVTVCEDVIKPGDIMTDKILDHLLKQNARMVVPIITPQALHSRYWSALGYEFSVQNRNLVFPVFAYPEGTRERLLEVLGRRCEGILDMPSTEVPMTKGPMSSTKISLTAAEIMRKASSSVVLTTYKITPEGCTLEEDGVTISFPKGCVKTERSLSFEVEMLPIDDALTKAFSAVTPVLTVHQDQEEDFLQPVRVTLPWAWRKSGCGADNVVLMERKSKPNPPQWTLLKLEFQETEDEVTFSTGHFCEIAGAKERGNDGNQEEADNQEVAEESNLREPGKVDEPANQGSADESITRGKGNKGNNAASQGVADESIPTKSGNPDEAANEAAAEEGISRKPGHQNEAAKQGVAEETTSRESKISSTPASTPTTEAFQVCWNRYTEDKVYLIINPNQARTENNYIHLICVHKDDDPMDFFRAANMLPVPPFHQRIVMGRKEMIDAKFDKEREVIGNPLDVSDGISFLFPIPPANCNRRSVGLILNTSHPAKKNCQGTVHFRLFSNTGEQVTDLRRRIPPAPVYLYLDQAIAEKELRKSFHRFSQNVTETREVEDLGVSLGLTADEMMSIIKGSKNQNPSYKAYNVLLKWMEKDQEASMDKLQQELSDFGMDTLAEKVGSIKAQPGQRPSGTSAGPPAKQSAAGQSSLDRHQKEQLTQLLEKNLTLTGLVEGLQGKTLRCRGPGAKPVVLLLNDEYGTAKGGVSTIHGQMAALLASKGAEVYSTVLNATEDDKKDAAADGVQLIFPTTSERDKRKPCLDWLTFYHKACYPDLPSVDFIVGHVPITSHAARQIKEQRFPDAKLVQVTHVMPEDTNPYKSDERVMSIGDEQENILEDLEHADVIISVGPYLHDYYKLETGGFEPHHEFLPKPSDIFSKARVKYVDTEAKVVLSIGRVKGVERLKGYDLVAKSMGEVIVALPNTKWRARGIAKEDFQKSRDIIQANAGKIHFTPLEYGTQKDLCKDMVKASVILMPSRAEPFGLVGLEAIAAGVPVVVSDKSGLAKFLKTQDPEFDHTIVEIGDDDDEATKTLAKRIIKILKDGPRQFQAAQSLKEKLLASDYWAASHTKFLQTFGLEG